jgi:dipeptidyl aminopeptidase/acylaminoacyl peptidase
MKILLKNSLIFALSLCFLSTAMVAQENTKEMKTIKSDFEKINNTLHHRIDVLEKSIDDLMWFQRLGDVAYIDKLYMTGPPLWKEKNKNAQGAGNPVKFWSYVFIPKNIDASKKYPLIVLPHGGVHADFTTYYTHIVRELLAQGYIIVAAEYRGSTGYGESHYKKIDYGGLETEDVYASRNYMIENYDIVDKNRVGIIGWSHGGLIALFNIFDHPDAYQVAYAGVPVSDLIARMGYKDQGYRDLYEAEFHIGESADDNVEEYRRRSPAWNTHKMKDTPLLIHTNTNDADVNVLEVEHLIKSLKADDKKFEYKIYQDVQGGHSFNRTDTKIAQEIRVEIYEFLAKCLVPPSPITNIKELRKAAYGF